ncbi:MAG: GTPase Era [Gammaproteobacteria bacterium]|nr:GTPase Era [Gammaproteobacteria bacterium]
MAERQAPETGNNDIHAGFIALTGRPNVGKSTLLNALVGRKVSIVTHKPQTTRHRIMGVRHEPGYQFVFVDTPGIHLNAKKALNKALNKAAQQTLGDVDVVVFMIEAGRWTEEDENVLQQLKDRENVVLVVNKVDRMDNKDDLLPFIADVSERVGASAVVPLSALKADNLDALLNELRGRLEDTVAFFPEEQVTDRDDRFQVAEIIREKLMNRLHEELPYALTVTVDEMEDDNGLLRIAATIWVERDGQKKIVIGKKGEMLKTIGKLAREELEGRYGQKVFLQLWVKLRDSWSDDVRLLKQFGIQED